MADFRCTRCGDSCGVIETEERTRLEIWGALVNHIELVVLSTCCGWEVHEREEDEDG